jgi:hypothetical protein
MSQPPVSSEGWRKSSASNGVGECVEFARGVGGDILIRDSKDPAGPVLSFTPGEWRAFLVGVGKREFEV